MATEYFLGRKSQLSFAREVDTAAESYADSDGMDNADGSFTGGMYVGHNAVHTVNDSTLLTERFTNNTTREAVSFYSPLKRYANNLTFDVTAWWFLYYTLGTCTTSDDTPSSGKYTHAFDHVETDLLPSFVLEHVHKAGTPEIRNYLGCTVNKLTLTGNKADPIKASLDYIAQSVKTDASVETVSNLTQVPYVTTESSLLFDFANSGAYTTGTAEPTVDNWRLTIDNNLYAEPTCTGSATKVIARPKPQQLNYKLEWTMPMTDDDEYDAFNAGTEFAVQLYVARDATNDYLKLTFEEGVIESAPDPIDSSQGLKMQTCSAMLGQLDATAGNRTAVDTKVDDYYEVL